MTAYYNEIDPAAAHILKAMIDENVIAPGHVDTRSIKDVMPDDLIGFTQCHFFAGGGLWSVAARLAGWPDDEPIWTGSCPCQPFSAAGKGGGTDDPRHLWPDLYRLIRSRRPTVVMGEQVAGAAGYDWFDGVRADLEAEAYAGRSVDFPACSVDAPHQRNRQYWVAMGQPDDEIDRTVSRELAGAPRANERSASRKGRDGNPAGYADHSYRAGVTLGDAFGTGLEGQRGHGDDLWRSEPDRSASTADGAGASGQLGNSPRGSRKGVGEPETYHREEGSREHRGSDAGRRRNGAGAASDVASDHSIYRRQQGELSGHSAARSRQEHRGSDGRNGTQWSDAEWIICHDGKARRTLSHVRSLAYGLSGRLAYLGHDSFIDAAKEVICYAYATKSRPKTVLRALRDGILSAQTRAPERHGRAHDNRLGSPEGFCPSQVLLAFVRELDRRCDESGSLFTVDPQARAAMRGVRGAGKSPLPPCGRGDIQQSGQQPANSLRELSYVLARYAETAGQAVGASDAKGMGLLTPSFSGRVDLWRVAGNAIVPQAAAEVIAAFIDVYGLPSTWRIAA